MKAAVLHCRGTLAATGARCGARVLRCLRCQTVGCNQLTAATCSQQAFVKLDCRRCHALGEVAEVPTDDA